MKTLSTLILSFICIVSCTSNQESHFESANTVVVEDSTDVENSTAIKDEPVKERTLEEIIKGFTDLYATAVKFDSAFIVGPDIYQIEFEHFCLFDKGVVVDSPYVGNYKMGRLVANNFASHLTVLKNGKPLFTKNITKKDFQGKVESALIKEGVLLFPNFQFVSNTFFFTYSLSIPITSVGVPVECKIDLNGNTEYYKIVSEKDFD